MTAELIVFIRDLYNRTDGIKNVYKSVQTGLGGALSSVGGAVSAVYTNVTANLTGPAALQSDTGTRTQAAALAAAIGGQPTMFQDLDKIYSAILALNVGGSGGNIVWLYLPGASQPPVDFIVDPVGAPNASSGSFPLNGGFSVAGASGVFSHTTFSYDDIARQFPGGSAYTKINFVVNGNFSTSPASNVSAAQVIFALVEAGTSLSATLSGGYALNGATGTVALKSTAAYGIFGAAYQIFSSTTTAYDTLVGAGTNNPVFSLTSANAGKRYRLFIGAFGGVSDYTLNSIRVAYA